MRLPDYKEARTRDKRDYKTVNFSFDDAVKGKYKGKKFFLKTYGCQMNEHDSENIAALLCELGFSRVEDVWNEIIAQYEEHGYEITVD